MDIFETQKINKTIKKESNEIVENPTVTVGIPVLNEEDHIERVVSGFLATEYPYLVEVLVADGGSTDRTREIVRQLSEKDSRVKLVDNPDKFQSFALNRMIEQAEGDIFLRADGHCIYQEDYLLKNIEVFVNTDAKNVGGAQRYVAKNAIQAGTALAVKSFLGNGGAKYMDENYEGYADTVFLGCFWTEDLRKIGGFNTKNITNQDSELNLRLAQIYGESVYVSPDIKSWYFPRSSIFKLFKQYFRYGRGRFLTKVLHPKRTPIRGLIPFIAICLLTVYAITDFFTAAPLYFLPVAAFLAFIVLGESLRIVLSEKQHFYDELWKGESSPPGTFSLWVHTSVNIIIMQVAHFSGFLYQLLKKVLLRVDGW